jgi:ubiquinone/menaquinone biosynthesis C-methylase UbiE
MSALRDCIRSTCVCPWWLIRVFDNPLRRLIQKPEIILQGIVHSGDHCLDVGCGFGYFTIPMARIVGPSGTVTAADLQPEMLSGVKRRAEKSGLLAQIRFHSVDPLGFHFDRMFDFALVFWMAHEVRDREAMFEQLSKSVKTGGLLLIAEPKGHVNKESFSRTVGCAEKAGFRKTAEHRVSFSRAILMKKV